MLCTCYVFSILGDCFFKGRFFKGRNYKDCGDETKQGTGEEILREVIKHLIKDLLEK